MRNRTLGLSLILILIGMYMTSCEKEDTTSSLELIQKAVNQKIETFKANKRQECREEILLSAEALVDSIIAEQLNLDTIDFPNKPIKPISPDIKKIPSEIELKPIK